jgi:hypothetical protein
MKIVVSVELEVPSGTKPSEAIGFIRDAIRTESELVHPDDTFSWRNNNPYNPRKAKIRIEPKVTRRALPGKQISGRGVRRP